MTITAAKSKRRLNWDLSDSSFQRIERALGITSPDWAVRNRIGLAVNLYVVGQWRAPLRDAAINKRLKQIASASERLHRLLLVQGEHLRDATSSPELEAFFSAAAKAKRKTFSAADLPLLPEHSEEWLKERAVLLEIRRLANTTANLDLDVLADDLKALVEYSRAKRKSKIGHPGSKSWEKLMASLAVIYQDITGEMPGVSNNEHQAEHDKRYGGPFFNFASLVDQEVASTHALEIRRNSALGPALIRVLRKQFPARSSKTKRSAR